MSEAAGIILALDIASRTGMADGAPGTTPDLYSRQFVRTAEDTSPTIGFGRAVSWMAARVTDGKRPRPIVCFVEGVVPEHKLGGQTNFNASLIKPALYGALTGAAASIGIRIIPCSIARVRTFVLGRGHGLKGEDGKKATFRKIQLLGWSPQNMDQSDAAAIWLFGCSQVQDGALQTSLHLR
jgi:hypothetical protein